MEQIAASAADHEAAAAGFSPQNSPSRAHSSAAAAPAPHSQDPANPSDNSELKLSLSLCLAICKSLPTSCAIASTGLWSPTAVPPSSIPPRPRTWDAIPRSVARFWVQINSPLWDAVARAINTQSRAAPATHHYCSGSGPLLAFAGTSRPATQFLTSKSSSLPQQVLVPHRPSSLRAALPPPLPPADSLQATARRVQARATSGVKHALSRATRINASDGTCSPHRRQHPSHQTASPCSP